MNAELTALAQVYRTAFLNGGELAMEAFKGMPRELAKIDDKDVRREFITAATPE